MSFGTVCPECKETLMRTSNGAVLCGNGHGRVRATCVSASQFNVAVRQEKLNRMPVAKHLGRGRWEISGRAGIFHKLIRNTDGAIACVFERPSGRVVGYFTITSEQV